MKTVNILISASVFAGILFAAPEQTPVKQQKQPTAQPKVKPMQTEKNAGTAQEKKESTAVVETSMGTFKFTFLEDKAPKTCDNFVKLAKKGFYDGLTFHRIIPNFMIQGGCPNGTGAGGPGYSIKAEFNDTKHVPGIVSMARSTDPDSAGSQFFVCVAATPFLDGKYTAFGKVIEGYDIVEKISKVKTGAQDRPVEPVIIKKVTIQ